MFLERQNGGKMNQIPKKEDMPYEKYLKKGAESLTDAELLALLLRTGYKPAGEENRSGKCSALLLAQKLLELPVGDKRGLAGLCSLAPEQLMKVKGIGQVKAVRICCISEMARRIARGQKTQGPVFTQPQTVADYYRHEFEGEDSQVEKALLLLLDARGKLIREKVLSIGTVNAAFVSPREVFLQALRHEAVHVMLLHNHPSGDVMPSREDVEITKKLTEIGDMMELPLLDHIIVGEDSYFSFQEAGLI